MARTLVRANTQIFNKYENDGEKDYFLKADGSTPLHGDWDLGVFKITNLKAPTADKDAANKAYVDSVAQGLDVKKAVRMIENSSNVDLAAYHAATGSDTLPGAGTDGIEAAQGDRILLNAQTLPAQNGIYVVGEVDPVTGMAALARSEDANTTAEVNPGMFTFVTEGTSYADTGWVLVTDGDPILDTDTLEFTQFTGVGQIQAGDGIKKEITGEISVDIADDSLHIVGGQLAVHLNAEAGEGAIVSGVNGLGISFNAAHMRIDANALELHAGAGTADIGRVALSDAAGVVSYTTLSKHVAMNETGELTIQTIAGGLIDATEAGGIRLVRAAAGQIVIGQGTEAEAAYMAIGGDATLGADGVLRIQRSFVDEDNFAVRQPMTATGSPEVFTLPDSPLLGSEMIFINGVLQQQGAGLDYTISGDTVTFADAPLGSDLLLATYLKPFAPTE